MDNTHNSLENLHVHEKIKYINCQGDYYLSFLEIVKKIYPTEELEKIVLSFKEQYSFLSHTYQLDPSPKESQPSLDRQTSPPQNTESSRSYSLGANILTILSCFLTICISF
jgi:hypothetical protein